eukprot:jgi/Tetstr1/459022/TSEL_004490.t1
MGRSNSKRRIPEGKEGWTAAEGIMEPVTKTIYRRAFGARFTMTRFYDTHRWACAEPPPPTAAPIAAGGDGAPTVAAAPYNRHASTPSGPGQTETWGKPRGCIDTVAAAIAPAALSAALVSRNETTSPAPSGGEGVRCRLMSMRQIVEKKMLEARVVAPTQNISHKLADVHDFPAVKAFLENVDKEISDRNKLWVPETEAWLGRQFKTDSIAAHTHQLVLNSHELQVHIVMGCEVLTHFVNYQDWKQAFFKAAFPNGIQTTVGDYARNICIKPSDPKMATCCVDLQRKLQAAFALLHEPFVVPEYLQVQRILQAIPKHERAEVQKMANHNNENSRD